MPAAVARVDACSQVKSATWAGEHAGETFDYRIVLKRGAWGPEHVVMTPEDLDMINKGSWPEVGSVSTENVDMNKITGTLCHLACMVNQSICKQEVVVPAKCAPLLKNDHPTWFAYIENDGAARWPCQRIG